MTTAIVLGLLVLGFTGYHYFRKGSERVTSRQLSIVADFFGFTFEPGETPAEELRKFEIASNEYQPLVVDRMKGNLDGFEVEVFDVLQHLTPHSGNAPRKLTTIRFPTLDCDEWIARQAVREGFVIDVRPSGKFLLISGQGFVSPDDRTEFIRAALGVVLSREPDA